MIVQPFAVAAQSLASPFLGVNINVVDFDEGRYVSRFSMDLDTSSYSTGSLQGILDCDSLSSSGGCDIYRLKTGSSGNNGLNFTLSTDYYGDILPVYSFNPKYSVQLEFIFDDEYIGSFDLSAFGSTRSIYVNGSSVSFTMSNTSIPESVSVSNLQLAKKHTETWAFPVESFGTVSTFSQYGYPLIDFFTGTDYIYPIYSIAANSQIDNSTVYGSAPSYFVFYINQAVNNNNLSTYFSSASGVTLSAEVLGTSSIGGSPWRLIKLILTSSSDLRSNLKLLRASSFVPIYCSPSRYVHVGTDFALQFGLSNSLLDNIQTLVDGTVDSATSAAGLEDLVDDKQDIMDETFDFEDQAADDLTSNLDDIDLPSVGSLSGLATGSFNFVSTQFTNLLTTSSGSLNPFGLSVTFILSIGLALLLIGKGIFK